MTKYKALSSRESQESYPSFFWSHLVREPQGPGLPEAGFSLKQNVYMCIGIYVIYIYIYIYVYREREIEICVYIYIYICMCIYIYIYIHNDNIQTAHVINRISQSGFAADLWNVTLEHNNDAAHESANDI